MRENRTSGSMRRGERRVMVQSANGHRPERAETVVRRRTCTRPRSPFTLPIAPPPSRPIASPATATTRLSTGYVPPGLLTPADMHHGLAEQRLAARASVLAAYAAHWERFPAGFPHPRDIPERSGSIHPRSCSPCERQRAPGSACPRVDLRLACRQSLPREVRRG
jgi:hypothetical protein